MSPHTAAVIRESNDLGYNTKVIVEHGVLEERAKQGWAMPDIGASELTVASERSQMIQAAQAANPDAVHITEGLRENGSIRSAQAILEERSIPYFVIMETVDNSGWRGWARRQVYKYLFRVRKFDSVLAIGAKTADWVSERGVPANRVFPFAYFLKDQPAQLGNDYHADTAFKFIFIGQMIERKQLSLLISALSDVPPEYDFSLTVIGTGELEESLREMGEQALGSRLDWLGMQPIDTISGHLSNADCLVLPSVYDGWGAVLSEALIAGTRTICSDTCGAAGIVEASHGGSVFRSGEVSKLGQDLIRQLERGKQDPDARANLADWAHCLCGKAGARYLEDIVAYRSGTIDRPSPPWEIEKLNQKQLPASGGE